jgi:hypothetical protein
MTSSGSDPKAIHEVTDKLELPLGVVLERALEALAARLK